MYKFHFYMVTRKCMNIIMPKFLVDGVVCVLTNHIHYYNNRQQILHFIWVDRRITYSVATNSVGLLKAKHLILQLLLLMMD